ncbi:MAG: anti-sigma factor antagonist [Clostridia bacterium]|nr:anti-sigma factor antagonist [Clostridia bacterium]MBP5193707.1 anti-sigma factor antagonist [Clostridia bacterium]
MEIKFKNVSGKLYVYLYGELDEYTSHSIRGLLDNLLDQYLQSRAVIFNLANLSFMDSTGLGFLIGRYKKLKSFSIPVYIESPPIGVEKVLQLSGIYDIMPKI